MLLLTVNNDVCTDSVPPSLDESLSGLLTRLQLEAGGPLLTGRSAGLVQSALRKTPAAAPKQTREELKLQLQVRALLT